VTVSVGHCHPHVVAAANGRTSYQHSTTIYLQPNVAQYAEKLASKMPGDLKACLFREFRLGGERPRAAHGARLHAKLRRDRLAQCVSRRQRLGHGRHGAQHWKYNVPHSFGVHHALAPYQYRGVFGYDDADAGKKYADDVKELIDFATPGKVAGSSRNPSRAWAVSWNFRRAISSRLTNTFARPAACASRTKCKRVWPHRHAFLGI
jgi:alanine-glyoxylate transaminase / (R)-3-amino-2-methylpropionate-pyruvate transaminase